MEVLLIQKLIHSHMNNLPDDGSEEHALFVKNIERKIIGQFKNGKEKDK